MGIYRVPKRCKEECSDGACGEPERCSEKCSNGEHAASGTGGGSDAVRYPAESASAVWHASAEGAAMGKEAKEALPGEAVTYLSETRAWGIGCRTRGGGERTVGCGSKGEAENERAVMSVMSDDTQTLYPASLDENGAGARGQRGTRHGGEAGRGREGEAPTWGIRRAGRCAGGVAAAGGVRCAGGEALAGSVRRAGRATCEGVVYVPRCV